MNLRKTLSVVLSVALLISALSVVGIPFAGAATNYTDTVLNSSSQTDLLITPENNILKGATITTTANAQLTFQLYDGLVCPVNQTYKNTTDAWNTSANWTTFALDGSYAIDKIMVGGCTGKYGNYTVKIFVGDADHAAISANESAYELAATWTNEEAKGGDGHLITFDEPVEGSKVVFYFSGKPNADNAGRIWISELAATGEAVEPPYSVYNITDGVNEDKIIAPENNILKSATVSSTDGVTPPALMYDGRLANVTDGYVWTDGGWQGYGDKTDGTRKLYLTWDLGYDYEVDSFLLAGSGVANTLYGANNFTVYVGDKTGAEIKADPSVAEPVYASNDLVLFGRCVQLDEPAVGRYIVFEMVGFNPGNGTANNACLWLTEFAAAGKEVPKPYTVTPINDKATYDEKGIYGDANILKTAVSSPSSALFTDDIVTGITQAYTADTSKCWVGGGSANGKLYVSFDLGYDYDVTALFLAGAGTGAYGTEGFTVYAAARADIAAENVIYSQTANVTYGLRVNLKDPAVTRHLTFELVLKKNSTSWQTWISEIGAAGTKAPEPERPYTRKPITAMTDLPESGSLIAGKTPTLADGKKPNVQSGGNLANITDGNIQGINQDVHLTLTQDTQYLTAKSGDHTYYSYIAPTSLVEAQGLDTTQTWYVRPQNGRWMHSNTDAQRAVLYGGTSNGGNIVYDLGGKGTIESLLIASSVELAGLTNNTYYDGEYDASKHPTMTASNVTTAYTPAVDNRLLYKAKVYVGDTKETIFDEENLVLDFDLSPNYVDAWRNLWELKEAATGRYVGFALNDTIMSSSNQLVRISELGVYGTVEPTDVVTEITKDSNVDKIIAPDDNILKGAKWSTVNASSTPIDALYDGELSGVTVAYTGPEAWAPSGSFTDRPNGVGTRKLYLTYDLGDNAEVTSLLLAGSGVDKSRYGLLATTVYMGDKTGAEIKADASVGNVIYTTEELILYGRRIDLAKKATGRYLVFEFTGYDVKGANFAQMWISEIAALGTTAASQKTKESTIVCIGDSITHGTYFTEGYPGGKRMENPYPALLETLLNEYSADTDYTVYNHGNSGKATVAGSLAGDDIGGWYDTTWNTAKGNIAKADTVFIMLGTNDVNSWATRRPYFKQEYKKLISEIKAVNEDVVIYVVTSPAIFKAPWHNTLAEDVVPMQLELAAELGLPVVDVYNITRDVMRDLGEDAFMDPYEVNGVRIHPDQEGAAYIADALFEALTAPKAHVSELKSSSTADTDYDTAVPKHAGPGVAADANRVTPVEHNLLNAEGVTYGPYQAEGGNCYLSDGILRFVNKASGTNHNAGCHALTVDFGKSATISQILLGGTQVGANKADFLYNSAKIYVTDDLGNKGEAVWSITDADADGSVAGRIITFTRPVTGRYLVFDIPVKKAPGATGTWLSEVAAVGHFVEPEEPDNLVKVVTVGDSITCGVVFPNLDNWSTKILENNYPKLVVDKLNAQNNGKIYELTNLAISGSAVVGNEVIGSSDTATSWYNQSKNKICDADILTIMLGTNDASSNWSNLRKPLYKEIYRQIVADFRAINPDLELYIITSPNAFKSPYKENLANDIIKMQKELAEELDATLIDVYSVSRTKMIRDGERSFIDDMDVTKGVRVHPGEAGHALIADVVYAGITGTELPEYIRSLNAKALGGQVRDGANALRFGFDMIGDGIAYADANPATSGNYARDLSAATITVEGKAYALKDFGAVVSVNADSELVLNTEDTAVKQVSAANLYAVAEGKATFTAVVTNIPDAYADTAIYARSYFVYNDGEKDVVVYGETINRSLSQCAGDALG